LKWIAVRQHGGWANFEEVLSLSERPELTIETVAEGLNYGRYRAEPLEPGYGTTMGNSLRRILLRSLEGVAISRVRIDSVWHEFSTVEGVREDVTELVLNLKRIRLRRAMEINGDVRGHLYARGEATGERVVTAGDVAWPAEVDVINPDQPIATLTSPDAVIDMDIWINQGRGYRSAETQDTYSLGEIPIDAIYTPVQKVNYVVEHTRVGQMTDFDSLILEILTDGTIEPDDALSEAAEILMTHAQVFAGVNVEPDEVVATAGSQLPEEVRNRPLADLGLSPRVLNSLRSRGVETVGQIVELEEDELMTIRNFGPRSMKELKEAFDANGIVADTGPLSQEIGDDDDSDELAEAIMAVGSDEFDQASDEE
jgi:DNA-directed RNA polymerase subunit alpha